MFYVTAQLICWQSLFPSCARQTHL